MFAWVPDLISWLPLGLPSFLLVISLVVFFHELGHFLVARAFKVGIETFSIGFGGEIFGWYDKHGTRWKVSWIPLGGYVKFLGDHGIASVPDEHRIAAMSERERAHAFHLKPLWQRALVVAAGPFANFLLAFVVFSFIYLIMGVKVTGTEIGTVAKGSPAAEVGLKPGDRITAVNGRPITMFAELPALVQENGAKPMRLSLSREGRAMAVTLAPRRIDTTDAFGEVEKRLALGIGVGQPSESNLVSVPVPAYKAPLLAVANCYRIVDLQLTFLGRLVGGRADAKNLSGPVGIAKITRTAVSDGLYTFVTLIAFISVSIGLINLFPIPLLDGGHLLYYGCEAVLGRPLKEEVQEVGFKLGLVLVLVLMIFTTLNDLVR